MRMVGGVECEEDDEVSKWLGIDWARRRSDWMRNSWKCAVHRR